jgi:protein-S-isoprenylcysteine O-methyltransferase Ste14
MPDTPTTESEVKTPKPQGRSARRMIQAFATMTLWIAAVFVSAGRLDWIRGWICVTAYIISMTLAGLLVRRRNPGLLEARANWRRKDTKPFDKVCLAIYLPLTLIQPTLAGLDAERFGWSSLPFATVYVGLVLFAMAMTLITWAMMVNPHAESTVRIQTDRNHKPVTSGPYRIVRHPMYVGAILMYPAAALMFGSMWALALSAVIAILFVGRTALEDRTLRRELPGYQEIATLTRYRLIPGLW